MSSTILPRDFMSIPPELEAGVSPHAAGMLSNPREERFYAENGLGQTYQSQDVVRFDIKSQRIIDPRSVRLHYTLKILNSNNADFDSKIAADKTFANGKLLVAANPSHQTYDLPDNTNNSILTTATDAEQFDDFSGGTSDCAWSVVWPCEHASSVFDTVRMGFNGDDIITEIESYNRVRAMLATTTIDSEWQRTHGQVEGYWPGDHDNDAGTRNGHSQGAAQIFYDPQTMYNAQKGMTNFTAATAPCNMHALNRAHKGGEFMSSSSNRKKVWTQATKTCNQVTGYNAVKDVDSRIDSNLNAGQEYLTINKTVDDEYAEWVTPLDLVPLFAQPRYLDMASIGTINLSLVLDTDDVVLNHVAKAESTQILNTDQEVSGSTMKYQIVNMYMTCTTYRASNLYREMLENAKLSGGLRLDMGGYEVYKQMFTSTTQQLIVNRRLESLKSVYIFFSDAGHVSGKNDGKVANVNVTSTFPNYGLNRYSIKINGKQINSHAIDCRRGKESRAIRELQKSLRLNGDNLLGNSSNTLERFHSDRCILGLDLETNAMRGGAALDELKIDLVFDYPDIDVDAWNHERVASFNNGITCYIVLHYDKTIIVENNNRIRLFE